MPDKAPPTKENLTKSAEGLKVLAVKMTEVEVELNNFLTFAHDNNLPGVFELERGIVLARGLADRIGKAREYHLNYKESK